MKHIYRMTITALFSAIGIILVSLLPVVPFAAADFLVYDLAEVPILLSTLFFGPVSGLLSLLIVCLFQAFLLGKDTFVGFFMHFVSSGIMLGVVSFFYYLLRNKKGGLIIGLIAGTIAMTGAMLLLNYIITPIYRGIPREFVVQMLPTIILPFNLMKGVLNSIMTLIIFKPLSYYLFKACHFQELLWVNPRRAETMEACERKR